MGGFAQDSWQIKSNLTLNYGLRWELMQYWSEKYNQIPTFIPGEQSQVYPTARSALSTPPIPEFRTRSCHRKIDFHLALVWPTPRTIGRMARQDYWGPGKTSIRAGYGIYYSVIQGNTIAFDEPQPPYGLSYTSPCPVVRHALYGRDRPGRHQPVSANIPSAERFRVASKPEH